MHTENTVKKTRRPRKDFAGRKQALYMALVEKYGEGSVISRKQLLEMCASNTALFPHPISVEHDPDRKVGRGRYVVTTSATPAKVRDRVLQSLVVKGDVETLDIKHGDKNVISNILRVLADILNMSKKDQNTTLKIAKGVNDRPKRAYTKRIAHNAA